MSHTFNKQPKDPSFLKVMRKTINKDRKLNGFDMEEEANELGLSCGTLEQKLKPSAPLDFTVSETMHLFEMSGDFTPLEYIANKYGFNLVEKKLSIATVIELHALADNAMIENDDVFRAVKVSMKDGIIDEEEKQRILQEIDEAQKANAELKAHIENM